MRRAFIITALLMLSACEVAEQSADAIARQQAKSYINSVAARFFPGVNTEAVTNCIIDNASTQEVLQIAQASVTGNGAEAATIVTKIGQRPAALQCIAAAGLAVLG